MRFDDLSKLVIGCAIEVHKQLGPGLLESTYERCLAYELESQGLAIRTQHPLPIFYKKIKVDSGYRVDILVENTIILELKSVDAISKLHEAQLLTYMALANIKTGLLLNFNVTRMKDGIRRFVL